MVRRLSYNVRSTGIWIAESCSAPSWPILSLSRAYPWIPSRQWLFSHESATRFIWVDNQFLRWSTTRHGDGTRPRAFTKILSSGGVRFAVHTSFPATYKQFSRMPAEWTGVLTTDSQGVSETLQVGDLDPREQETPVDLDQGEVVLDCLCPDWDLLWEIQSAMKLMPPSSCNMSKVTRIKQPRIFSSISWDS